MTAQANYPTSPQAPAARKLPGKVGIWIGSILMALAVIGGGALFVGGIVSLSNVGDDLQRVPVPEGGSITIAEEDLGTQTVFAETRALESGTSFSSSTRQFGPLVEVQIIGPDGQPVRLTSAAGSTTYNTDGYSGREIGQFEASRAGRYEIRPVPTDGSSAYISIAVGSRLELGGLWSVFGGLFGGGALFVVGLIVLIVSLVRRSSAKRSLRQPAVPWGGPGPGGPAYGVPGYGAPAPAPAAPAWQPPPMGSHGPAPEWMPGQGISGPPAGAPLPPVPGGPPPLPPRGAPAPVPPPPLPPTPDLTDISGPPPLPSDDFPPASPQGPVGPSS